MTYCVVGIIILPNNANSMLDCWQKGSFTFSQPLFHYLTKVFLFSDLCPYPQIERLQASIQTLCKSANPLGKNMDYVQVRNMQESWEM